MIILIKVPTLGFVFQKPKILVSVPNMKLGSNSVLINTK